MRSLTSHKVNPANSALDITATDEPGAGGASCRYVVSGFNPTTNPSALAPDDNSSATTILFQNGPIPEVGVNGFTNEALLAILIDRLQSFQRGPFSCRENSLALTKLEEAAHWLNHRTSERTARGVEGTHNK